MNKLIKPHVFRYLYLLTVLLLNPFICALSVQVTYTVGTTKTVFNADDVFKPDEFAQQMGDSIRFGKNPRQTTTNNGIVEYNKFKDNMTQVLTDLMTYSASFRSAMIDLSNTTVNGADFSTNAGEVVWNDETIVLLVSSSNRGYVPGRTTTGVSANLPAWEGNNGQIRVERGVRQGIGLDASSGLPSPSVVSIKANILNNYQTNRIFVKNLINNPPADWATVSRSDRTKLAKINDAYQNIGHELSHSAAYAKGLSFPISSGAGENPQYFEEYENMGWVQGQRPISERLVMQEVIENTSPLFTIAYTYEGLTATQMRNHITGMTPPAVAGSDAAGPYITGEEVSQARTMLNNWDQSITTYYRNNLLPNSVPADQEDQWIADRKSSHSTGCPPS